MVHTLPKSLFSLLTQQHAKILFLCEGKDKVQKNAMFKKKYPCACGLSHNIISMTII